MRDYIEMTWEDLDALDREKTCFFQVVAPVEEHSRHLPLGTDLYLGEAWTRQAATSIEERYSDLSCVIMPPLPIAAGSMPGFPGCLYQKPKELRRTVCRQLEPLAKDGFKNLIIVASHGDPLHLIALEKACVSLNRRYGPCALSPLGAIVFSGQRPAEALVPGEALAKVLDAYPNDYHAGWIETSLMLAIGSSRVRSGWEHLPPVEVAPREMIDAAACARKTRGYGHLGCPALASEFLGRELNDLTAENLAIVTIRFIEKDGWKAYEHHALWKVPVLRMLA